MSPAQAGTTAPQRGDNHPGMDGRHEDPEQGNTSPGHGEDNPGTGGGGAATGVDTTVDVAAIVERFEQATKMRLKDRTRRDYAQRLRTFADLVGLKNYTRRQLAGPTGKRLLLAYLDRYPRPSWRTILAVLRTVWLNGLGLPWPIDIKSELGKLPKVRAGESPPDEPVKAWAEALRHEPDTYARLLWLLIAQHGWRSSHVTRIKWRNVRYDGKGKPIAIVADGVAENFKTSAPVAARLAPDVAEALRDWKKESPSTIPEAYILPFRSKWGKMEPGREMQHTQTNTLWEQTRAKWRLPKLRPKDMRHWVATQCRKADLSKQASALLMGHDSAAGGAMRDWYDRPQMAEILDEQAGKLPEGPLGRLVTPEITIVEALPAEAVEVVKAYMDQKIGTMELASRLEAIRLRRLHPEQVLTP
ncbi:MAG: site-specific integrase [Euryarchaeota archaeon]|nr:site-specific integrase [Euryarchaeota archaeon]